MKRLSIILLLALQAFVMQAQTVLRVEAPNVVAKSEEFNVTFIIEGEDSPSDFSWSEGNDFKLLWGPQKGRSTSVQIINGKRTKSSRSTYTYVLMANGTGKFSLPAAVAKVKGKELVSEPVTIEVVNGKGSSSDAQAPDRSAGSNSSADRGTGVNDEDIFLRFTLDRTSVVVGEPITATLKLYQKVDIAGFEDAKFPSFNGFWSQETLAPTNIEFKRESYNDDIYGVALLRKYVLIPQQAGTLTIDPAELVCLVNVRVAPKAGASIFDGFFDDYRTIRKRVTSSSYKVNVSPLPSGAPASFGGGVGRFSISASLSRDSLVTHEAASLIVTVTGQGNVSLLDAPKVVFPPDFEVYDTKVSEKTDNNANGMSGSKTYEFPFIPRSHGDFVLEPIKYSYYDVRQRKYVTVSTEPMAFTVAKGRDGDAAVSAPSVSRSGVKSLNEDIRFITVRMPSLAPAGKFFVLSAPFYGLAAAVVVLALIAWAVFRKVAQRRADVTASKNRKATKMALKRLRLSGDYLKANRYTEFYEELHKALLWYVSDKLNIAVADLTKERIAESLTASGVGEELSGRFVELIDACEFARYSPESGHVAMAGHYNDAVDVISSIDSCMKVNKGRSASVRTMAVGVLLLLSVPCLTANAQEEKDYLSTLWEDAASAYSEGRWEEAADGFSKIASTGSVSAELYCNIGDSFFKAGEYPRAVLNYERALKIDPSFDDARYNLEIVSRYIQDRIDPVPEFILKDWTRSLCYVLDSDSWAALFILFLALCLAMTLLFVLSAFSAARKTGFFTAILFLLLAVSSLSFSLWQRNDYMKADSAIVMRPVTSVKSSPSSEASTDLFILHEGTKVFILDEVGQWRNISLADGRQGWMLTSDMEVI